MGLRDLLRARRAADQLAELAVETKLTVVREDSSFEGADGSTIRSLGYTVLDPTGGYTQVGDDDWMRTVGCRLCKVAGVTHHDEAVQDERFAAGSVVVLAPDPENPVDDRAVGVWEATGELQAGFVPAAISAEVADRMAAGELLGGIILREYRTEAEAGRRVGLVMLIAPFGKVTLRVEAAAATSESEPG